eukprot:UN15702
MIWSGAFPIVMYPWGEVIKHPKYKLYYGKPKYGDDHKCFRKRVRVGTEFIITVFFCVVCITVCTVSAKSFTFTSDNKIRVFYTFPSK